MEQLFADIIRTMIDYWMTNEAWGPIISFMAVIELAVQSAMTFMAERGTTAPINAED